MKSKKGVSTPVVLLMLVIVAGVVVFGVSQSATTGQDDTVETGANCNTEPYISLNVVDDQNRGTSVSGYSTQVISDYSGSKSTGELGGIAENVSLGSNGAKFQVGDSVAVLVTNSGWVDEVFTTEVDSCGKNDMTAELRKTSAPSISIKTDDGTATLADQTAGGTGVNQSTSSTSITNDVQITGNSEESTGTIRVVAEYSNGTQADSISLSGASDANVPEFYSSNAANNLESAFSVDELVDGERVTLGLQTSPESGQTLGSPAASMYTTYYGSQWFADTDGSFKVGVEDSNGNDQSEWNTDYDFAIQ